MFTFEVDVPRVLLGVTANRKAYLFNFPEDIKDFEKGLDRAASVRGQVKFDQMYNKDVPVFVNMRGLDSLEDANNIYADLQELNSRRPGKTIGLKSRKLSYKVDGETKWNLGFRYLSEAEQARKDALPAKRAAKKAANAKLISDNEMAAPKK